MKTKFFFLAMALAMVLPGVVFGQQKPSTGYAPVNGLKMYYEIHGQGEPVVLLHGAFMAVTDEWGDFARELSKTRKVIAVEMQGHGRTAEIKRDLTFENLSDDVAGLLDYLKIPSADVVGYSLGGGVAIECAIRHPDKVRKVVSLSAPYARDGWVKAGSDALANLNAEMFKGSPAEMVIGDSIVIVSPSGVRPALPAFLYLYVPDTDAAYREALRAGAKSLEAPANMHYGDRRAMIEDPHGNTWQIATHVEDVSPEEIARRLNARP